MEEQVKKIMQGIINKQGLIGQVAKMYVNDEMKAKRFIKECREQTHNKRTQEYWGKELVREIEAFCDENKNFS